MITEREYVSTRDNQNSHDELWFTSILVLRHLALFHIVLDADLAYCRRIVLYVDAQGRPTPSKLDGALPGCPATPILIAPDLHEKFWRSSVLGFIDASNSKSWRKFHEFSANL